MTAFWKGSSVFAADHVLFVRKFQKVFDHSIKAGESSSQLFSLWQGQRFVADYSIDFLVIAAGSGWNGVSLRGAFYWGLSETAKDELAA